MQLLITDYVVGFRLRRVYLLEALSSALSTSVIVCAEYVMLLSFVSLKPFFFFILSIDVLSTLSRQMIKKYGDNVSSCTTPATISQ